MLVSGGSAVIARSVVVAGACVFSRGLPSLGDLRAVRALRARGAILFAASAWLSCDPGSAGGKNGSNSKAAAAQAPASGFGAGGTTAAPIAVTASAAPDPDDLATQTASPGPRRLPCPSDMVVVEGEFCPEAEQECVEYHPDYLADRSQSERCLRYAEPSLCSSSQTTTLQFCIDRFEWPNRAGEKPRVLTQWSEAAALCEARGKRLCEQEEWLFACEGPQMLPYTNGFRRDPTQCVVDRLYIPPRHRFKRWAACQQDPQCSRAFRRVDQREPSGAFPQCVSPFGAFDMNGNVNEWVAVVDAVYPRRSGLKGGWWGPVRNRCRPTVRFHREDDWGYEIGFRCCRDVGSNESQSLEDDRQ